jgi:hypothetical protein
LRRCARRLALRESFLERTRTGDGLDFEALLEQHGWTHGERG